MAFCGEYHLSSTMSPPWVNSVRLDVGLQVRSRWAHQYGASVGDFVQRGWVPEVSRMLDGRDGDN